MKRSHLFLTLLFAALAAALRLWQNQAAFDAEGLCNGHISLYLLPATLLAGLVTVLLCSSRYPCRDQLGESIEEYFLFGHTDSLLMAVTGAFLLLGSGALSYLALPDRLGLVELGLQSFGALCLLMAVFALRRGSDFSGFSLLLPLLCLTLRTILFFRESSKDPILAHFYVVLLALLALCLFLLSLAGFAYRDGCGIKLTATGSFSVILCAAAAPGGSLADAAAYLGCALLCLGFMRGAEFDS